MHIFSKLAVLAAAAGISLSAASAASVQAQSVTPTGTAKLNLRQKLEERIENIGKNAVIVSGQLTAINGNTLTLTKDGKSYTINVTSKTNLRRRYWGKSSLSEMQVNDNLNVYGKWSDEAKTTIEARMIRDISIQKRFGVFVGTINSISGNIWTIATVHRGNQSVTVSGSTKFTNRKNETITQTDVKTGNRVRVSGLWDKTSNTITEVSRVKDFTLPVKVQVSVTPAVTVTP